MGENFETDPLNTLEPAIFVLVVKYEAVFMVLVPIRDLHVSQDSPPVFGPILDREVLNIHIEFCNALSSSVPN